MKRKVWTKCETCKGGGFNKRRRGKNHTSCTRECRFAALQRSRESAKDTGTAVEAQSSGQETPTTEADLTRDSLVSEGA